MSQILLDKMDNRASNSRISNSYPKSIVFPRINTGTSEYHENKGHKTASRDRKEDSVDYIMDKLKFLERVFEIEKRERNALQDHVEMLTSNMQKLGNEVSQLQVKVMNQGEVDQHQRSHERNFEALNSTDLWNRLNFANLNAIKVNGELNKLSGDISDLRRHVNELKVKIDSVSMDKENADSKHESQMTSLVSKLKLLKDDIYSKIATVEERLESVQKINKGAFEEIRNRELIEATSGVEVKNCLDSLKKLEVRIETFAEEYQVWTQATTKELSSINDKSGQMRDEMAIHNDNLSRRIEDLKISSKKSFKKSYNTVKDSYREAFRDIYESITTMQAVLETKLKVTETDLKSSINSILRSMSM